MKNSIIIKVVVGIAILVIAGVMIYFFAIKTEKESGVTIARANVTEVHEATPEDIGIINDALDTLEFEAKQDNGYQPIEFQVEGMFNDKYTMQEYLYLCGNTYYELRGQNDECQRAGVSVPINRANDPYYYPDSIIDVIEQKGQYQGAIDGMIYTYIAMYKGEIEVSEEQFLEMERVAENVAFVLEEGVTGTWEYQAPFEQGINCIWIDGECYGDRRKGG